MVRLLPAWLHPFNAPRPHLRSSFLIDMVFHILLRTVFAPPFMHRFGCTQHSTTGVER